VTYLIGDAGMGKTFTVFKALDVMRSFSEDYRGYKIIPIYIDLHEGAISPDHMLFNVEYDFFRYLTNKVIEKATSQGIQELSQFIPPENNFNINNNFMSLALHLARQKRFLLMIFDNTDRFYFDNSKYCFFDKYAQKRDKRIDDNLLRLIYAFVTESQLGYIGASVLFVCRKYVFNHCRNIQDVADRHKAIMMKHTAFQLYNQIEGNQVIESRLELLRDAVQAVSLKYASRGKQYSQQLQYLEEGVSLFKQNRDEKTLNTIWRLSHQGLRSFLDFLCQIEIDYKKDNLVIDRLFHKPHNLMRLYLTNMRKRFSQKIGHFPNLFLVDGLIDIRAGFEDAHKPHIHTYWLKYFILKYSALKPNYRVSSAELFQFFHNTLGYEKELVLLAIGSLAEPCCGRCFDIIPTQQATNSLNLLQLSDRGKVLIGAEKNEDHTPLCFSFDYLQLVTDDFWLSFPTPWFDNIYVDASISHTLKNDQIYAEKAYQTLSKKIPAVLYFLRVLKAAMHGECTFKPQLKTHSVAEKLLPDFSVIEENIFLSCSKILGPFENGAELMNTANSLWKTLNSDSSFGDHFVSYGESKLLITTDM
jgi:hypothetical protein